MLPVLGLLICCQLAPVRCTYPGWGCEVSGVTEESFEACSICKQFLIEGEEEHRTERFMREAQSLEQQYQQSGYLDVEIEFEPNPPGKRVDFLIKIREGPQYIIREVRLKGVPEEPSFESEGLYGQLLIKPQTVYDRELIELSARRLRETGRFQSVTFDIIKCPTPGEVDVSFNLSEQEDH